MKLKVQIALLSYWALFILLPTLIFALAFRGSPMMVVVGFLALVAFILLGQRGYKEWKKLFKIN